MGTFSGLGNYVVTGSVEINSSDAIGIEAQFSNLDIKGIEDIQDPRAYLVIEEDPSKRLPIGKLPKSEKTFNMLIAAGVDVSPYNALLIRCKKLAEDIGMAKLP